MVVTLLTDFGTADYFVGAMKGAVLKVNPSARLVDITHHIPPHDIAAAAFTLAAAYESFPEGTIHLVVVDPGVGSARRGLIVEADGSLFVGPDNGVFGYIYERAGKLKVYALSEATWESLSSTTFHGRDVFAPTAGRLSLGVAPSEIGRPIEDFVRLELARPRRLADGSIEGKVIHTDRFGNLITNFRRDDLNTTEAGDRFRILTGGFEIRRIRRFFAEGDERGPFGIWGSAGFLEIAINRESAAEALGVRRGDTVRVLLEPIP